MSDELIKKQQVSNEHYKDTEIVTARVVANYGDPGIDSDYHFDIVSRFVIVMIESIDRIPTVDKNQRLFALVKRPKHLWIQSDSAVPASGLDINTLRRTDSSGNVNAGSAQSYSINSIPRMNSAYTLGEQISIRRLKDKIRMNDASFFGSAFHENYLSSFFRYSASFYSEGQPKAYIDAAREPFTRTKPIRNASNFGYYVYPINGGAGTFQSVNDYTYYMAIDKYQFELFWLHTHSGDAADNMVKIFNGEDQNGSQSQLARQNGYYFINKTQIGFSVCAWEDLNVGGKRREASADCMPLVVTTPNTFPTPSRREIGTILYNPTYEVITQE